MNKLSLLDASFLYLESEAMPMNIASVQLLELPTGQDQHYFQILRTYLRQRIGLVPFMTRRLQATPFGLDQPVWVDHADFDLDQHLHQLSLPLPGSQHQLEDTIARLHEQPLPRSQPLWSFHLIQGLGTEFGNLPGKPTRVVALYCKYHHACMDGMGGQGVIDKLFSRDPDQLPPVCPIPTATERPDTFALLRDAAKNLFRQASQPMDQMVSRSRAAQRLASRWWQGGDALGALGQAAPDTPFNTSVSPYRSWAMGSIPLPQAKALGKTLGCSVNDVVMAACAGGLRRYLQRHGKLPDVPLRCGVPVSLRPAGDSSTDNQVTMLVAALATNLDKPLERLQACHTSVVQGMQLVADTQTLTAGDLHLPGLGAIFGLTAQSMSMGLSDLLPRMLNLVVSNVRGPSEPVYLCGARMLSHYPVSIPAHGTALNLTVQSYCNRIDLGVTACLEAVPDTRVLRDDLLAAWEELAALADDQAKVQAPECAA